MTKLTITNIDYNDDLAGFIIRLSNDKIAQIQFDKNQNRLNADYGSYYPIIDEQNDYGLDLTEEEEEEVYALINSNPLIQQKAAELTQSEAL